MDYKLFGASVKPVASRSMVCLPIPKAELFRRLKMISMAPFFLWQHLGRHHL